MFPNGRVQQTTSTIGTGTVDIDGAAVAGSRAFMTAYPNGGLVAYRIDLEDQSIWEQGVGTLTAGSPPTLARTQVFCNSSGGTSALNLPAGTKRVYIASLGDLDKFGAIGETPTTAGTATAITVSYDQPPRFKIDGMEFTVKMNAASAAGGTTVEIDGYSAAALDLFKGNGTVDIAAGDWTAGEYVTFRYNSTLGAFVLKAPAGALRVSSEASQEQQEAATAVDVFVSPRIQHYHPSAAKAWARVNVSGGTPTLAASYNITSITDSGAGVLDVTIATDFSSANWCCLTSLGYDSGNTLVACADVIAAGSVRIISRSSTTGTATDPPNYSFAGYGDQ